MITMTGLLTDLTASRVDAFDDWFSTFDDGTTDEAVVTSVDSSTVKKSKAQDLEESWVDSSDDEDGRSPQKTKQNRPTVARKTSGDLEQLFWAANPKPTEPDRPSSSANSVSSSKPKKRIPSLEVKGKKAENQTHHSKPKSMKFLNEAERGLAKKVQAERRASENEAKETRRAIRSSVERYIGKEGETTKVPSPETPTKRRVRTPVRPKRSPVRKSSGTRLPEAVGAGLSGLYGQSNFDTGAQGKESSTNDERSTGKDRLDKNESKSIEADIKSSTNSPSPEPARGTAREERAICRLPRPSSGELLPRTSRHCASSRARSVDPSARSRTRDPLSRSAHPGTRQETRRLRSSQAGAGDMLSSSSHGASLRRSSHGPEREKTDPLSRSSHGRIYNVPRQNPSASKGETNDPLSSTSHSGRRRRRSSHDSETGKGDRLSRSSHGCIHTIPPERPSSSERKRNGDRLSRSSHGCINKIPPERQSSSERKRSALSSSCHGYRRRRSFEEGNSPPHEQRRRRSSGDRLSPVRITSTEEQHALQRRRGRSSDLSCNSSRCKPPSGPSRHSQEQDEEALLRLAISSLAEPSSVMAKNETTASNGLSRRAAHSSRRRPSDRAADDEEDDEKPLSSSSRRRRSSSTTRLL